MNPQRKIIAMERRYQALKPEKTPSILNYDTINPSQRYDSPSYRAMQERASQIQTGHLNLKLLSKMFNNKPQTAEKENT